MTRSAYVEGIGFWSSVLPDWPSAQRAFVGAGPPADEAVHRRPAPTLLGANERRRAPDAVLIALLVAEEATRAAGRLPASLASVFTSAHGDLAVVDALCRTLAVDPQLLSPTRFHHSVHNAASGYWAIAGGSHEASSALAGFDHSFGSGLLEALVQVAADLEPVLLVGCDTEAVGALASINRSRGQLGVALVLAAAPSAAARLRLDWSLQARPAGRPAATGLRSAAARALAANAHADALPLLQALAEVTTGAHAGEAPPSLALAVGAGTVLALQMSAWPTR